jgi:membrane-bound lytic murein transglycosylase MltF
MRLQICAVACAVLASALPPTVEAQAPALKVGIFGGAAGVDTEVLRTFARTEGLALEALDVESADDAMARLKDGRAHVVAGLAVTEALKQAADFTNEVLPSRLVVVTRKPAAPVPYLEALRGIKIGLVTGSPAGEALSAAKLPSWNQVPSPNVAAALGELRAGRTAALVLNVEEALRAATMDSALQTGVFLGPRQSLAYAVRKGNAALLGGLNAHVGQLRMSPSWPSLLARQAPGLLEVLTRARLESSSSVN